MTPPTPRRRFSLTFVDATHGYAIVGEPGGASSTRLEYTTDGAISWHRARLPGSRGARIGAVAGHGNRVFAATVRCHHGRCATALYASKVGLHMWRNTGAALPRLSSGGGLGLAAWGSSVWLALGDGGDGLPVTLYSSDAGATFTAVAHTNAVACAPRATSPRVAWTTCSTGMLLAFQRTVGAAPPRRLPVSGAGTGGTFVDPLSDRFAYFGTGAGKHAGLYCTRDGGRTFTRVAALPRLLSRTGRTSTFLDRATGLAPGDGLSLLRTSNGGHTWHTVHLDRP